MKRLIFSCIAALCYAAGTESDGTGPSGHPSEKHPLAIEGYDAKIVASKTWEQFKEECDEQSKANKKHNPNVHFGAWGDQRDAKLREVYDACIAAVKPATAPPPKKEDPKGTKA